MDRMIILILMKIKSFVLGQFPNKDEIGRLIKILEMKNNSRTFRVFMDKGEYSNEQYNMVTITEKVTVKLKSLFRKFGV